MKQHGVCFSEIHSDVFSIKVSLWDNKTGKLKNAETVLIELSEVQSVAGSIAAHSSGTPGLILSFACCPCCSHWFPLGFQVFIRPLKTSQVDRIRRVW